MEIKKEKTFVSDEEIKEIIRLFNEGNSIEKISKKLGRGWNTIQAKLHANGIFPQKLIQEGKRNYDAQKRKLNDEQIQEMVNLYEMGVSTNQLVEKFALSQIVVRKHLRKNGIDLRNRGNHIKIFNEFETKDIIKRYENGESQQKIAKFYECSQNTISRILRKNSINTKKNFEKHGNWTGGKITTNGYYYVLLQNDNPYYSMTHRGGYVAEHRLVMAQKLGRPLKQNESVHHIDGNRKNNNPNNLQLRHGNHGHGQKFCCADCGSKNIISLELD